MHRGTHLRSADRFGLAGSATAARPSGHVYNARDSAARAGIRTGFVPGSVTVGSRSRLPKTIQQSGLYPAATANYAGSALFASGSSSESGVALLPSLPSATSVPSTSQTTRAAKSDVVSATS